jgi:ABC-type transport system substrate-binding protein
MTVHRKAVLMAIYESMLVYNPADGTTTPWLATDWEVAPDSSGITYHLREGVKWSDGEPQPEHWVRCGLYAPPSDAPGTALELPDDLEESSA